MRKLLQVDGRGDRIPEELLDTYPAGEEAVPPPSLLLFEDEEYVVGRSVLDATELAEDTFPEDVSSVIS